MPTLLLGRFRVRHVCPRAGLTWDVDVPNGVTVEGRDYLLGAGFKGAPQSTGWRLLLVSDAGFAGVAEGDTHALHPGWTEFLGVSGGSRPAWPSGTPAGGVLDTLGTATVTLSAAGVVRGVGLANQPAVGSVAAGSVLYSTAVAAAGLSVSSGGVLYVTYTIRGTPVG